MTVYLDANLTIYLIEQPPVWGHKAKPRVAALRGNGELIAISDLTRMECQVKPLTLGDAALLANYAAFFSSADVRVLPMTGAVFDQAARIRATYKFKTPDALHLAAAIEHGCGLFMTSD